MSIDIDDEKKIDQLILITNDNKRIIYSIKKFAKISKVFDEHINCESFNKFSNKKDNNSIEYILFTNYKLINWILDEYYVGNYFNVNSDYLEYKASLLSSLEKIFLIDIYIFSVYMKIIQLKFDIERYILKKYIKHLFVDMFDATTFKNDIFRNELNFACINFDYLIKNIRSDKLLIYKIKQTIYLYYNNRNDIISIRKYNRDDKNFYSKYTKLFYDDLNNIINKYID